MFGSSFYLSRNYSWEIKFIWKKEDWSLTNWGIVFCLVFLNTSCPMNFGHYFVDHIRTNLHLEECILILYLNLKEGIGFNDYCYNRKTNWEILDYCQNLDFLLFSSNLGLILVIFLQKIQRNYLVKIPIYIFRMISSTISTHYSIFYPTIIQ